MKTTFALLALLPCLALSVEARSPAATQPVSAEEAVPSLRARFNAAIDELKAKASAGKISRAEYQKAHDELTKAAQAYEAETPHALGTRERLMARLAELETKAQTAMFELLELDILKDEAIDAELDYAIARLRARASAGKWTREDYQAVVDALTARANAAKSWNPEIDAIHGRFVTELNRLMERAKATTLKVDEFETVLDLATETRASMVLARLEKRALEKKAIDSDFKDVSAVVARIPEPNADLLKKVQARLDEIKAALAGGRVTREQFVALRDELMVRARAASSSR